MKRHTIILGLLIMGLISCYKQSRLSSSPMGGKWKLEKIDVNNAELDSMDFGQTLALMLAEQYQNKMSVIFTDKHAIMRIEGDNTADTALYSIKPDGSNDYNIISGEHKKASPMTMHMDAGRMKIYNKAITYNFTRTQ